MADEKAKKAVSSIEDRVKEIEEKLARHKEQEQKLNALKQGILNREKEKERKARTRRLIQNGALSEQYLRCDGMPPDQYERLLKIMIENKAFNEFLGKCLVRLDSEDAADNNPQGNTSPDPVASSSP
jgi:phage protein D